MLLAWGRFPVSKAIIPDGQEHFLTPSAHRDTHIFGGLGLKQGVKTDSHHFKAVGLLVTVLGLEEIETLEGRRNQIVQALAQRNIHLLAGGSLERYLPSYSGDEYQLTEAAKKQAVQAELEWLVSPVGEAELLTRYGDLFSAIRLLPSEPEVDTEPVIRKYLRDYVHRLQGIASDYPAWQHDDVETTLKAELPEMANVFSLRCFQRSGASEFQATVVIAEMLGQPAGIVRVDNKTVAGTGAFTIELA